MKQTVLFLLVTAALFMWQTNFAHASSKKHGKRALCGEVRCRRFELCLTVAGIPTCGCRDKCPRRERPLCANDGNTYRNYCELKRAACTTKKLVRKKHKGQCDDARKPKTDRKMLITRRKKTVRKMPKTPMNRRRPLSDARSPARPTKNPRTPIVRSTKNPRAPDVRPAINLPAPNVRPAVNPRAPYVGPAVNSRVSMVRPDLRAPIIRPTVNSRVRMVRPAWRVPIDRPAVNSHVPIVRPDSRVPIAKRPLNDRTQNALEAKDAQTTFIKSTVPNALHTAERKPLVCYQIERDQLRLLLVDMLKSEMKNYGRSFADVTADQLRRCDRNRDGTLDTTEFRACIEKPDNGRSPSAVTARVLRALCVDALIVMADSNVDWKLDLAEFRRCLHPYFVPETKRCSLEGKEYPDNSQTTFNCNSCVCTCGSWVCTDIICIRHPDMSTPSKVLPGRTPSRQERQELFFGFQVSRTAIENLIK